MKTLIATTLAAVSLSASVQAAAGWHTDFAAAKQLAAEEKKDLLLDFTGSDWCGWCKKLKQEVFDHKEFTDGVKDLYVLVEIDYPRDKSGLTATVLEQNAALKKEFAIRGYPTIMLADAEGRPYAQTGYRKGGPEAYVKDLAEKQKHKAKRDEALAKAKGAEGEQKSAALEAALKIVPQSTLASLYKTEFEELAKLNAKSALVTTSNAERTVREQRESFRAFFTNKDYDGAIKQVDELIAQGDLKGEARQQVLIYKLNASLAQGKHDDALKAAEEIQAADPESRFGKSADRYRKHIETLKQREEEKRESGKEETVPAEGKKGAAVDPRGKAYHYVIAQDDEQKAEDPASDKAKKEEPKKEEVKKEEPKKEEPKKEEPKKEEPKKEEPDEKALRKAIAGAREELTEVSKKIDSDHELWESSENQMEVAKARMAELEAGLAEERARYAKLEQVVARIEKEHNGDHDRADELTATLAKREKALVEFESKQDEITKLEKKAAELRRQAEALRKKAEELRNK